MTRLYGTLQKHVPNEQSAPTVREARSKDGSGSAIISVDELKQLVTKGRRVPDDDAGESKQTRRTMLMV